MDFSGAYRDLETSFLVTWEQFLQKFPEIVLAILFFIVGYFFSRVVSQGVKKALHYKTQDVLIVNFLGKSVRIVLFLTVIFITLNILGLGGIATGLLTAAGAGAIVLGFAFKDIGENFISGVILSFNRPFDLNDTVKIDDIFGKIKAMELRYTKVKTFDGRDVYIPNSDIIKKAVYNYTEDGYYRIDFVVGIDYDDDIETAKKVILDAIVKTEGVINTDDHECFVTVDELGVSTVNMRAIFWTKTKEYRRIALEVKSDVVKNVKNTIIKHGLNMPADITEIKLYGSQDSIPVTVKQEK